MLTRHISLCLAVVLTGCAPAGSKPEFLVAAAADLRIALGEIAAQFQRAHPEAAVKVSYGSSGQFTQQIENGAPFDVLCSADSSYPKKLAGEGFALPGSEFIYAIGRLVLWVPDSSPLQLTGPEALRDPSLRHIAIANPAHAPYGKAAETALRSMGLYDAAKDKLVYGENVSQALQFAETGAAGIGIVPASLVQGGRSWEVPQQFYPKLEQGGIIMKRSRNAALAQAFRAFLLGEQGRTILKRYGFYLP